MGADGIDLAALHDNDPVCVLYRSRPLGDNDLGSFRNVIFHGLPDPGICSGIHRTGGIIQDQYFRLFQKGSGNTEPLLLAAGYIGSSLFYVSVVSIRKLGNKLIGAGHLAGLDQFLICSLLVSPTEIIPDGTGKKDIFLKDYRHLITQGFQIIISYVYAPYLHSPLRHIIQTGDQLDQGRLGRACTPDNANGLSGADIQINIL